jgi:uncharacterized protein
LSTHIFPLLDSGLFSFASTTLILSFYNTGVRNITTPNVVVGMALGVGGLAQLLAGMWEFAAGNTFGATGKISLPQTTFFLSFFLPSHYRPDARHPGVAFIPYLVHQA